MLQTLGLPLVLFPVLAFVPGFLVVRRLGVPAELRLPLSVAMSVAFLYGAGFLLYLLDAGPWAAVALAVTIVAAGLVYRREALALLRAQPARDLLLHWALLASWLLLLALSVRNISGGGWMGDWEEHYQRAGFFCGELPLDFKFIGIWPLPARPPLHNVVASVFLRLSSLDFAAYQVTAVLLASLQLLGAAALWSVLTRGGGERRAAGLLVLSALVCLNPSIVENAVYPWTRALTGFFLLQGAALYLLALRDGAPALRRWAYLLLGLALATHYSTVPYLAGLAVVELRLLLTRRLSLREAALCALIAAAPVAPWLAFSLARFGVEGTFLSNSTVAWNASLDAAGLALRAVRNLARSLVPHPLRPGAEPWPQAYAPSYWRDYAFTVYQASLPALMGSLGGIVVAGLLARAGLRRLRAGGGEVVLLGAASLVIVVALGTGTVADDIPFGVAHVCLQPLAVAGLVYLAARWTELPAWLRGALSLALVLDAALGIGLQFWMQSQTLDTLNAADPDLAGLSELFVRQLQETLSLASPVLGALDGRGPVMALLAAVLVALVALAARRARPAPASSEVTAPAPSA